MDMSINKRLEKFLFEKDISQEKLMNMEQEEESELLDERNRNDN